MKFIPQTFNDLLALILMVIVIPGMWIAIGLTWLEVPEVLTGATIPVWTLVAQYYFRKKESES